MSDEVTITDSTTITAFQSLQNSYDCVKKDRIKWELEAHKNRADKLQVQIENRDWKRWLEEANEEIERLKGVEETEVTIADARASRDEYERLYILYQDIAYNLVSRIQATSEYGPEHADLLALAYNVQTEKKNWK